MGCCCVELLGWGAAVYVGVVLARILFHVFFPYFIAPFLGLNNKLLSFAKPGEWAVVTGATDGIGKGYAKELGRKGYNIFLISRTQERLDNTATEIKEESPKVEVKTLAFDFNSPAEAYSKISAGLEGIQIGILVNNVGLGYVYPEVLDLLPDGDNLSSKLLNVNCLSATLMCRMVLPRMKEQKSGAIINISSASARFNANPYLGVYACCKKYVGSLTYVMDAENRDSGIFFQTVYPFFVATKMSGIKRVRFTAPDPDSYAKSAIGTIGWQKETVGCFAHALQGVGLCMGSCIQRNRFSARDTQFENLLPSLDFSQMEELQLVAGEMHLPSLDRLFDKLDPHKLRVLNLSYTNSDPRSITGCTRFPLRTLILNGFLHPISCTQKMAQDIMETLTDPTNHLLITNLRELQIAWCAAIPFSHLLRIFRFTNLKAVNVGGDTDTRGFFTALHDSPLKLSTLHVRDMRTYVPSDFHHLAHYASLRYLDATCLRLPQHFTDEMIGALAGKRQYYPVSMTITMVHPHETNGSRSHAKTLDNFTPNNDADDDQILHTFFTGSEQNLTYTDALCEIYENDIIDTRQQPPLLWTQQSQTVSADSGFQHISPSVLNAMLQNKIPLYPDHHFYDYDDTLAPYRIMQHQVRDLEFRTQQDTVRQLQNAITNNEAGIRVAIGLGLNSVVESKSIQMMTAARKKFLKQGKYE